MAGRTKPRRRPCQRPEYSGVALLSRLGDRQRMAMVLRFRSSLEALQKGRSAGMREVGDMADMLGVFSVLRRPGFLDDGGVLDLPDGDALESAAQSSLLAAIERVQRGCGVGLDGPGLTALGAIADAVDAVSGQVKAGEWNRVLSEVVRIQRAEAKKAEQAGMELSWAC